MSPLSKPMTLAPLRAILPSVAALCVAAAGGCAGDLPSCGSNVASSACVEAAETPGAGEPGAENATLRMPVYEPRTTSATTAVRNLNAQVDATRERHVRLNSVSSARSLIAALEMRVQLLGRVSDLDEVLSVAESIARDRDTADAHRVLSDAYAALHRFDEAAASLDTAAELGADVHTQREALAVAAGTDVNAAADARVAAALQYGTFENHTAAGAALSAAGRYAEADDAFIAALESYRDVSPFAAAWVQFQRGVLWGEAVGNDAFAETLYRDAVRLMPDYTVANVHLAELELGQGLDDDSIARLSSASAADDPEPWSRLAEALAPSDPTGAAAAAAEALARYEALLAAHELAFADHAAEFFLGAGDDVERAHALAMANLANRQTDRSYELAVTTALATDRMPLACALLADAGEARLRVGLVELRDSVACPDAP